MKVQISSEQNALECPHEAIRRVLSAALRREGKSAELSVALVDDHRMAELNRRYLGREGVTDVLAFPYGEGADEIEGEIVVNAELALRRGAGRPHGPEGELMLYVVHGVLHLLGYDDHRQDDVRRMRRREQAVLAAAGYRVEF